MPALRENETMIEAFNALLAERHSCRAFLPDRVPDDVIARIVATAQQVPSWCNAQPWQLIITRDAATIAFHEVMAKAVAAAPGGFDIAPPARYQDAYKDRRRDCGWQLYQAVGVARGDRAASAAQMRENYRFFGAPHVAVVTTPKALGAYGVLDCGAFVTGFMLAAQALGVASIAQAAIAAYSDQVRAHFGIGEDRDIVCAISFGLSDAQHPANQFRTSRASVDEVVDWR